MQDLRDVYKRQDFKRPNGLAQQDGGALPRQVRVCEAQRSNEVPSEMCIRDRVRFFALRRIKPHTPLLVRAPVNSFEFQPCGRTPQVDYLLC